MRQPWKIIADLEADNSRLAKEAIILAQAEASNNEFFEGVKMALDALVTFGLKQIPEKTNEDGPGLSWDGFNSVVMRLCNRQLTGNVARSAVDTLLNTATKEQWNEWYRRILIKDLRCGVSEKTINNVVKKKYADYSVPVFTCQLAHDGANHESKVSGSKLIEVKLDGVRVLTIVYPNGRVDQFSRNGKSLVNFEHIKQQFASIAGQLVEPWVFDGEVMSSSFQDLMKQVHRKSDVDASDAVLYLFDSLSLADFQAGKCELGQAHRSEGLRTFYEKNKETLINVTIVGHELVDLDSETGQQRFNEINKTAIEGGYEGIMIKDPQAPYELKRSVAWLKQKPFIEVTLEVTDVEEGTGKNVGRLGALVCSGSDDGKLIAVNVGSGFTDDLRISIWNDTGAVIGQLVEIRADAITQNQDGSYSLRFPRFRTFRGFEIGEKL